MGKLTLEFDTDTEAKEGERAVRALDLELALWDIREWLHREFNHPGGTLDPKTIKVVYDQVLAVLDDREVTRLLDQG